LRLEVEQASHGVSAIAELLVKNCLLQYILTHFFAVIMSYSAKNCICGQSFPFGSSVPVF